MISLSCFLQSFSFSTSSGHSSYSRSSYFFVLPIDIACTSQALHKAMKTASDKVDKYDSDEEDVKDVKYLEENRIHKQD